MDFIMQKEEEITKEEQLQNYFAAIETDKVDNLIKEVTGAKAKKIARELLEIPNLLNTDTYSLKMLVELLVDIDYLSTQTRECQKSNNLMLYTRLLKTKLDCIAKANTILAEFGLTPKARAKILVLDMEE